MYIFYLKKLWVPQHTIAKLLLIMRLTTIILITAILQVSASSFAQKITLSETNIPLAKVLSKIRLQSGYDFLFTETILKDARTVSIQVRNEDLNVVLKRIFENQPLQYSIEDKSVVISKKVPTFLDRIAERFAAIDVRGVVLDEEGGPLPGAIITVKGTGNKTVANAKGAFYLQNVEEKVVLTISYVGYIPKELNAATDLGAIQLSPLNESLKEIEVFSTGYQSIARERSAGSIAKPNMDIVKQRTGSMNLVQRLDGLIPGMVINNSGSKTGNSGKGSSVIIRGLSTISDLTNRDPLFIVNGVPVSDINSINPNDVEDVTVLKDATSASIWGARAANGVIVVTTKKGTNNTGIKINYDGFVKFGGRPDLAYKNMLNSSQFIQAATETFSKKDFPLTTVSRPFTNGVAPIAPHEVILYSDLSEAEKTAQLAVLAGQNNLDQIRELWYRNSALMNHTMSLSAGGEKYSFYGSGSYTNTQDQTPGNRNKNYGLNLRQDFKFNERIKIYLVTDLLNNVSSAKNMVSPTAGFLPYVNFKNADGSNADMPWLYRTDALRTGYETKSKISLNYNPLDEINTGKTNGNLLTARLNAGLTVNLLKGLRYEGVFGLTRAQNKIVTLLDQQNYAVRSEVVSFTTIENGLPKYNLPEIGGRNTVTNMVSKEWTVRNQLVYTQAWQDKKHQLDLLAGQEAQEYFNNSTKNVIRGYNSLLLSYAAIDYAALRKGLSGTVFTNTVGSSILNPDLYTEVEGLTRITSYYANGGYSYDEKYTVNAAVRIDESNLFGKRKSAQNRPVWSAGLAWQAGKEEFIQNQNWLNKLVLRASYGITGNSPNPGVAASEDILSNLSTVAYPGNLGLRISTPANNSLSWERTRNTNLGIDFSVLNSRIGGSLDLYSRKTDNLIGFMEVNPVVGYTSIIGNAGDMTNKGIELSLSSMNITGGDFRWNTLFTFAYNKNKITRLNLSAPVVTGANKVSKAYLEGYPAFSVFAYNYAGLDKVGDPQIRLNDGSVTKSLNVAKPEDVKYMGSYQPKWTGGLSNMFGYKDFTLGINAVYSFGAVMRRDVNSIYSGRTLFSPGSFSGNTNAEFANRWKIAGDEANTNVPAYMPSVSASNARRDFKYYTYADINVLDAAYIKLRDITLGYSLPVSVSRKLNIEGIKFSAQVSNVMLWKANRHGIDPEFFDATGGDYGGVRGVPINQHTITLGAHLIF